MNGEKEYIGLCELQRRIKGCLEGAFSENVWVRGEISEMKVQSSGHCYLTLVEKDPVRGTLKAKASAIIWASSWRLIRQAFESETGGPLQVGMNILVRAQVQYSELYSLSLIVYDIDSSFSIGEMELARRRSIARLQEEGMMDMNSLLPLPLLPRRFAVITSETAAGWRDFRHHLLDNEYGYSFTLTLFPALMQGSEAPASIISAMDQVAAQADSFDALLIMRGGGGAMDLVCFDDYDLAVNVAQFPIPVLTGIGHDHDYHIIDMVAHTNVKTPTALADYAIDNFAQEEYRLDTVASRLRAALESRNAGRKSRLDSAVQMLRRAVDLRYSEEERLLQLLHVRVQAADPKRALERGCAFVSARGKMINSASSLKKGDSATLLFSDGTVEVEVK